LELHSGTTLPLLAAVTAMLERASSVQCLPVVESTTKFSKKVSSKQT
jgi:hypothetical protein